MQELEVQRGVEELPPPETLSPQRIQAEVLGLHPLQQMFYRKLHWGARQDSRLEPTAREKFAYDIFPCTLEELLFRRVLPEVD